MVWFILLWTPVLFIFAVILWLRSSSLEYVEQQRKLDRCLYSYLSQRCSALSGLSKSNNLLKQITRALVALETTQKTVLFIPGLNSTLGIAAGVSAKAARQTAEAIAQYQNMITALEEANALTLWKCGFPAAHPFPIHFVRPETFESKIAKVPAPLKLKNHSMSTEVEVQSRDLKFSSFAHCATDRRSSRGKLSGERYAIRFQRQAKLPLRP
ncbi:MAG: hypothetical protein AB1540_02040 [Bdellovibrionota bacterium]